MKKVSPLQFDDILEDLAEGEASPCAIAQCLAPRIVDGMTARDAQRLYDSCAAFVFRALRAQRSDSELAAWVDVLGRMAAAVGKASPALTQKFEVFIDLLYRSRAVARAINVDTLKRRKHVREILLAMAQKDGTASRRQLMRRCDLRSPNLSRVIGPLLDTGLVSRETRSREVVYSLSVEGMRVVRSLTRDKAQAENPVQLRPGKRADVRAAARGGYSKKALAAGSPGVRVPLVVGTKHHSATMIIASPDEELQSPRTTLYTDIRAQVPLPSRRKHQSAEFHAYDMLISAEGLDPDFLEAEG